MARSPMAHTPAANTPAANTPRINNASVEASILEEPQAPRHSFPAVFFLDSRVFQLAQVEMPRITMSFSPDVVSFTREGKLIATRYFEDIHTWMPIVSKYRFYNHLMNPLLEHRSDLTILLFCMRLISWSAVEHADGDKPRTRAYLAAKRLLVDAESAGILTLQILQAILLVTIYEIGHGIYPAAYITIGTCARYGTALGIDRQKPSENGSPSLSEVEQEERRRVWWAIVILDRFMSIGFPGRSAATETPGPNDLLPTDDALWDQGKKRGLLFTVSSPATVNMGSFARLAKATYLLCLVLQRTNIAGVDETSLPEAAKQLDQDIRALTSLPDVEGQTKSVGGSPQTAFCDSALFILHDPSSSRTDPNFVQFARDILMSVVEETFSTPPRYLAGNPSPLLIPWMYQAASVYSRLLRVTDNEDSGLLENLKLHLRTLNRRWMVAGIL
ncbi:hypothetical protein MMC22_005125 [Lobaria immixta]|nr:hypothetical protein [Lobaria immixta]